jgi:hypothetical protein
LPIAANAAFDLIKAQLVIKQPVNVRLGYPKSACKLSLCGLQGRKIDRTELAAAACAGAWQRKSSFNVIRNDHR